MTRRTIKAWYLVHKWTSLICTAFLLMLCVTGLPLIFHEEIDAIAAPRPPLADAGYRVRDLDQLLAGALARHPGEVPLYLSFDADRPVVNVTTARDVQAPGAAMHFESIDRRTGAPLPPHGSPCLALLLRIHTDLCLGLPAELLLGAMGLLFVGAIVSGVVLYMPFMARLRFGTVRRGRTARLGWLDRHNLLGIVTVAWAAVVGITGTINTLVLPITAVWKVDQLAGLPAGDGPLPTMARRASVQAAMETAMRAAPDRLPQFIAFPGVAYSSPRHYAVFLQGATPLTARVLTPAFVDAASGRLDAVRPMPWYMQALLLAQPLHFGDYAGLAMKLLWAVLDLFTIAVLGSGLYLWLGRKAGSADVRVRELVSAGTADLS